MYLQTLNSQNGVATILVNLNSRRGRNQFRRGISFTMIGDSFKWSIGILCFLHGHRKLVERSYSCEFHVCLVGAMDEWSNLCAPRDVTNSKVEITCSSSFGQALLAHTHPLMRTREGGTNIVGAWCVWHYEGYVHAHIQVMLSSIPILLLVGSFSMYHEIR